jgi:pimeloyl-ACP methyl ester carboxylesterase
MPLVHANDQKIFYADRNLKRRPVLLLIHGAAGSHLDWPAQLRRFDPFGSCALDLPGHGRSPGPARSVVNHYADDVLSLASELGLSELILVGHSMGGAIALDIALRLEKRVAALVLVATGARLRVNDSLLTLVESDFKSAVDHIEAAAWGPDAEPELLRRASHLMLGGDPRTMAMDFAACDNFDVRSELNVIAIPTLVLVGSEDRLTPPKFSRYLADRISGAELNTITGAGHMLAMEQPEAVRDAIADFAQRRLARG